MNIQQTSWLFCTYGVTVYFSVPQFKHSEKVKNITRLKNCFFWKNISPRFTIIQHVNFWNPATHVWAGIRSGKWQWTRWTTSPIKITEHNVTLLWTDITDFSPLFYLLVSNKSQYSMTIGRLWKWLSMNFTWTLVRMFRKRKQSKFSL